ncbi:sensor histidine kinase [Bacillus litorisediminis]|uniref:sensor histidine kinase n=1 Tax=Bacillus litorisediminis TaxID=2922713 RepID=UPI001FAF9AE7|nr:histidine kinase [Bacillus litorisediminis]
MKMLLNYYTFSIFVILAIFAPLAGTIALLVVLAFEKQIDGLTFQKQQVQMEKELQESEYMQLNQQIQPHFLFNTMNLMLGLARLDRKEKLIQVMEAFSHYLKFKYQVREHLIPLNKEWEYTQSYIHIQKIRFQNRLRVDMILNPDANEVLVPPYLIHTLVENAFKHGLEKKPGDLYLKLQADLINDQVTIIVTDNGIGIGDLSKKDLFQKGHGLPNIHRRLKLLYDQSSLDIKRGSSGGTKVSIVLPKMLEDEEEPSNEHSMRG